MATPKADRSHDASEWDTDTLVAVLREKIPDYTGEEGVDAARDYVEERVRAVELDGKKVLTMVKASPTEDPEKKRLLDEMFSGENRAKSMRLKTGCVWPTASRSFEFAFLSMANLAVAATARVDKLKGQIFQVIPQEKFAPEFDAFYDPEDMWCIKCGQDKAVGNTIHGWAINPGGWLRLALKLDDESEYKLVFDNWHKAYHGTAAENIARILDAGLKKGGTEGVKVKAGKTGAVGGAVYCSPCIEYASHWLYTTDKSDMQKDTKGESAQWAQFVLELRVHPDAYRIQGNTLWGPPKVDDGWPGGGQGGGKMGKNPMVYDKYCVNDSLEWIIGDLSMFRVTGVMLRFTDKDPKALQAERIVRMKPQCGWNSTSTVPDQEGEYARPRNEGGTGKTVEWQYNANINKEWGGPGRVTFRNDKVDWQPFPEHVNKTIENAYQQYQRVCFIGTVKLKSDDPSDQCVGFPRFIDFMEWSCDGQDGREGPPEHHHAETSGAMCRRADDQDKSWRLRSVRRTTKD